MSNSSICFPISFPISHQKNRYEQPDNVHLLTWTLQASLTRSHMTWYPVQEKNIYFNKIIKLSIFFLTAEHYKVYWAITNFINHSTLSLSAQPLFSVSQTNSCSCFKETQITWASRTVLVSKSCLIAIVESVSCPEIRIKNQKTFLKSSLGRNETSNNSLFYLSREFLF